MPVRSRHALFITQLYHSQGDFDLKDSLEHWVWWSVIQQSGDCGRGLGLRLTWAAHRARPVSEKKRENLEAKASDKSTLTQSHCWAHYIEVVAL